jgi:hypothetical protein
MCDAINLFLMGFNLAGAAFTIWNAWRICRLRRRPTANV